MYRVDVQPTKGCNLKVVREFRATETAVWTKVDSYMTNDLKKLPKRSDKWIQEAFAFFNQPSAQIIPFPTTSFGSMPSPPSDLDIVHDGTTITNLETTAERVLATAKDDAYAAQVIEYAKRRKILITG